MRIGYNTNGWAHHHLLDAIDLLGGMGYQSVAITIDQHALNPFDAGYSEQVAAVRRRLERWNLTSVVETGARFLLDPRLKHEPTLVSPQAPQRARRVEFLQRAVDLAAALGSECVSFWSGIVRDDAPPETVWERLVEGLKPVIDDAADRGVPLGFEPEPGMWIDTMDRFQELLDRLQARQLQLTLDIGHLWCLQDGSIPGQIRQWADRLVNVHLEDMRAGVHEHLMFGEGEMDFAAIFQALAAVRYAGGVHVELSRHSHMAPEAAERALRFLQPLMSPAY